MAVARSVACCRSLEAPLVTSFLPKISSSATRPPMHTSRRASICLREMLVWSLSGSCVTMPSACPRGTMVALCTGIAPSVFIATSAWPPSWYAVSRRLSSEITALLRSAPMRILSFAYSSCDMPTAAALSMEALSAATLTRLASSAPLKPGVPRAMISKSTSSPMITFFECTPRICLRPSTSGLGTTTSVSKRPGRTSALSSVCLRFVAASTITPAFCLKPSSSTSSWLRVMRMYCWSFGLRFDPMASISSMNTMHGELFLAAAKRSRTRRAPTPTNISSNSLPLV
mmetsp:Transcript_8215/g.25338  ORF Transcript_8215/g.25338 Transcript_8215/m.25338 type:complete len:286 (-) Transcript_8215:37-894(-)